MNLMMTLGAVLYLHEASLLLRRTNPAHQGQGAAEAEERLTGGCVCNSRWISQVGAMLGSAHSPPPRQLPLKLQVDDRAGAKLTQPGQPQRSELREDLPRLPKCLLRPRSRRPRGPLRAKETAWWATTPPSASKERGSPSSSNRQPNLFSNHSVNTKRQQNRLLFMKMNYNHIIVKNIRTQVVPRGSGCVSQLGLRR